MNIDNMKQMLRAEAAAEQALASLNETELAAYREAYPQTIIAAGPKKLTTLKPVGTKPAKPASPKPMKQPSPKRQFNASVHAHFQAKTGRKLADSHKKAISDGLRRWHAAHGKGTYTNKERKSAVKHLTKRFGALVDHHVAMHAVHKQRAQNARKSGDMEKHAFHMARAKNSLKKHKVYSALGGSL